MKKFFLSLNHLLFPWYYKRVSSHFQDRTIVKSILNLIDNYNHQEWLISRHDEQIDKFCKLADQERKMRLDIQMKMIASNEDIDWANNTFGLNIKKRYEN